MPNFNQVTKKEVKVREREVQLTQAELAEIKIITKEEASELIEDRLPIGLFMIKEQQVYVVIDNTTGEAWAEEFSDQELCTRWLKGEVGIDELNEQVEEVHKVYLTKGYIEANELDFSGMAKYAEAMLRAQFKRNRENICSLQKLYEEDSPKKNISSSHLIDFECLANHIAEYVIERINKK